MRHLLLLVGLLGSIFFTTANAQSWNEIGDFAVRETLNENGEALMLSANNEIVQGRGKYLNGEAKTPFIYYAQYIGDDGNIKVKFNIGYVPYSYDSSSRDANYLDIQVIGNGDKSTLKTFKVRIFNDNGFIKILNPDGYANVTDFGQLLYSSNFIHVKVGDNVYKFNTKQFKQADEYAEGLLKKGANSSNPFAGGSNSNNPFQR